MRTTVAVLITLSVTTVICSAKSARDSDSDLTGTNSQHSARALQDASLADCKLIDSRFDGELRNNANRERCLNMDPTTFNAASTVCNDLPGQHWLGCDDGTIRNLLGKCLTIEQDIVSNSNVNVQDCTKSDKQKWSINAIGRDDLNLISPQGSELCLDIKGASGASDVLLFACDDLEDQNFFFNFEGSTKLPTANDGPNLPVVIGSAVGGFGLLVIIAIIVICACRRRKGDNEDDWDDEEEAQRNHSDPHHHDAHHGDEHHHDAHHHDTHW